MGTPHATLSLRHGSVMPGRGLRRMGERTVTMTNEANQKPSPCKCNPCTCDPKTCDCRACQKRALEQEDELE